MRYVRIAMGVMPVEVLGVISCSHYMSLVSSLSADQLSSQQPAERAKETLHVISRYDSDCAKPERGLA